MVRLVQRKFRDGTPLADLAWAKMVIILKGKGEYQGILLIEVAWKVCAVVANFLLKRGIVLHDALYRFRGGRGTGTATLEAKLAQQLAGLAHNTLFQVFLDICKAYDSLDMERCIEALKECGVGTNLTRLIKSYWEHERIATNTGKFIGKEFRTGRGLVQGDPASPMIFNTVVDAVVREFLDAVYGPKEAKHGLVWTAGERNVIFYANDGSIAEWDHEWV